MTRIPFFYRTNLNQTSIDDCQSTAEVWERRLGASVGLTVILNRTVNLKSGVIRLILVLYAPYSYMKSAQYFLDGQKKSATSVVSLLIQKVSEYRKYAIVVRVLILYKY